MIYNLSRNTTNQGIENFLQNHEGISLFFILSPEGKISNYFSKISIDDGEKNRITASFLATIALADRTTNSLIQENTKNVVIKGDKSSVFIKFIEKNNVPNYLCLLIEKGIDIEEINQKISNLFENLN